jgi:hypothetical protein
MWGKRNITMAVNDRMIRRRPVKPGPVKPKPSKGKNPKLPYRSKDEGFAPKGRTPGKGNPPVDKTLPRRSDPGFGPKKRPTPVKPKPKGGNIRDLLYRKPKDYKSKQEQMIQSGAISIMRRPKMPKSLNNEKARKDIRYLNMMGPAGPAPKRDNSAVTYRTRVKPKFPSMMEGPYRIKKATVKTGRGR